MVPIGIALPDACHRLDLPMPGPGPCRSPFSSPGHIPSRWASGLPGSTTRPHVSTSHTSSKGRAIRLIVGTALKLSSSSTVVVRGHIGRISARRGYAIWPEETWGRATQRLGACRPRRLTDGVSDTVGRDDRPTNHGPREAPRATDSLHLSQAHKVRHSARLDGGRPNSMRSLS